MRSRKLSHCFWSAGLLENNRPYFAEYKGFYLYVLTSARGVRKETAENTFLQKLIARGLVEDRRKDPPSLWPFLFERIEPDGDRYWVLRIEGESREADTLDDGELHAEFLMDTESQINTVQKIITLAESE